MTRSKQFTLLEEGFSGHLAALIAQGNRKQHAAFHALKSKSWIHAYGVLLFKDQKQNRMWIEASRTWQRLADDIAKRGRVQPLAIQQSSSLKEKDDDSSSSSSRAIRDRTAWSAMVWYHHLDQPGPIPDRMQALGWIKEKPHDYDAQKNFEEYRRDQGKFNAMMNVVFQQNVVSIPVHKQLYKKQVGALRDILSSFTRSVEKHAIGIPFCQFLDAHLSIGKDDEDTAFALMEEITVQRMAMWTLVRHSFARDQVHRIQVLLRDEPRNLNRIRNLTRVFPRLYADEIPEMMRTAFHQVQKRLNDMVIFLELVTPHVLDASMVDAIFVYTFLVVIREYLHMASNSYMSDWIANFLSNWLVR